MTIREIMTKETFKIKPDNSLRDASIIMKEQNIGFLIVFDKKLRGVITDRDIVLALADYASPEDSLDSYMSSDVITIYADEDISSASDKMGNHQVRRLVVVDEHDQIAGVVSLGDLSINYETEELALEALCEISYDLTDL